METTDSIVSERNTEVSFADSLREFASWLDEHPDLEEKARDSFYFQPALWPNQDSLPPIEAARALSPCNKRYSDNYFELSRWFGQLRFEINYPRSSVCERRVVRTVEHPAEAALRPAWTEEIVEWDCKPLLENGDESQR